MATKDEAQATSRVAYKRMLQPRRLRPRYTYQRQARQCVRTQREQERESRPSRHPGAEGCSDRCFRRHRGAGENRTSDSSTSHHRATHPSAHITAVRHYVGTGYTFNKGTSLHDVLHKKCKVTRTDYQKRNDAISVLSLQRAENKVKRSGN
jgi:hypothetical protein